MDNGDKPASPMDVTLEIDDGSGNKNREIYSGLTKREYFAGMAMQGLIHRGPHLPDDLTGIAVNCADALLAALENKDGY